MRCNKLFISLFSLVLFSFFLMPNVYANAMTAALVVCPVAVLVNTVIFYYLSIKTEKRNA